MFPKDNYCFKTCKILGNYYKITIKSKRDTKYHFYFNIFKSKREIANKKYI